MMGYQEIMTDPSYKGQIVTMTYPLIGNYGANEEDHESIMPQVEGFVVKENSLYPSNWRSKKTLDAYLKENNIVGIEGIDTRSLTRHIRDVGAQEGIISSEDLDSKSLLRKAKKSPGLIGRDLVKEVTCKKGYQWSQGEWSLKKGYKEFSPLEDNEERFNVVAYDLGIKYNILRKLVEAGCNVTVVPADTEAEKVLELNPDGIFLSNGPGDPEGVPYVAQNVKKLLEKKPIFGICLGHQILGLAFGGKTFKLKFGHRGGNQPVMDLSTEKVEITSQNHGFAVDSESLPDDIRITHINLNDRTVEGLMHQELPIFSVQYHPEASPGPHDASYLFKRFMESMRKSKK